MELVLTRQGNLVRGKFLLHAFNDKGVEIPPPIPFEQEFTGTFANGFLNCNDTSGRFSIARVGKHLAVIEGNFHQLGIPGGQTENLFAEK